MADVNKHPTEGIKDLVPLKQGKMFAISPHNETLPNHFNMYHGKATDLLSCFLGKSFEMDNFTGRGIIESKGIRLKLESTNEILKSGLKESTLKLLFAAIGDFTARNGNKSNNPAASEINYDFYIPIEQFALLCNCDIVRHEIDKTGKTKEQIKAERLREEKRADRALTKFKKKVLNDLNILRLVSIQFYEKLEGREQEFDLGVISSKGKGIEARRKDGHVNGYITGTFDPNFAKYLLKLPQTTFLTAIFAIDERNKNAFKLACKLQLHYFMYNNQIIGTANTLRVSTLLSYLSLPEIEQVRNDSHSWDERIKKPFEELLDRLVKKDHILTTWNYGEENYIFNTYEEWINGKVYFELQDPPDNSKQIEQFKKQAAENAKKREKEKQKKKKRN